MKEHLLSAIGFIVLGFLMVLGMRLTEYTLDRPLPTVMICIVEEGTATVQCTPFDTRPLPPTEEGTSETRH